MCISSFVQKKCRKDKTETKEMSYLQKVVGKRDRKKEGMGMG